MYTPDPQRRRAVRSVVAATLAGLLAAGCSNTPPAAPKPTFVLVHGAFQDERAWSEVSPRLQAAGHKVVAVRLAGRPGDGTPVSAITLDTYRDQITAVLSAEAAPVVLVGHSFGGISIANAAEAMPQKVKTLVFVAAYLPTAGAPDQSMAKLAETDQWNGFTKDNFIVAKDYSSAGVLPADVVALFCADCSPADQARTQRDFFQAEPLKPAGTPVKVSAERYGSVPKVYVKTLRDRAISPQLQQQMIERTPVRKVVVIDSGHSPFLSQPQALAEALLGAAVD
jgi:pimeloyl-ACP methyl ester carboxylesterase